MNQEKGLRLNLKTCVYSMHTVVSTTTAYTIKVFVVYVSKDVSLLTQLCFLTGGLRAEK